MKASAITIDSPGGPEVMRLREVELGEPGPGEARLRQEAVGVNFLDVYQRSGAYSMAMPAGVGNEAAGVVDSVGEGVELAPGDRVAYQGGSPGSYASARIVEAHRLVRLPGRVDLETAAAAMLKGMTAEYLLDRCVRLGPGDHALMYAAAGGVGLLAGQWAAHRGIRLIGVASGPEKCALALANGYAHAIDRRREDVAARVREITGGQGVPAVFDSVGKATFEASMECLAPLGTFVSFGATSGPPPPVAASELQKRGSLYFTRPTLMTYTATPELYAASAAKVVALIEEGALRPTVGQRYALADAAEAHRDLEAGRTTGATLLIP